MKAIFKTASPYAEDAMNLPVANVEAAISFYETIMGFHLVSRNDSPYKSAVLARDGIQIGLAENGGDSSQEGCFFEVDSVEAAFEEIKGVKPLEGAISLQKINQRSYQAFFIVAPDGLCYMIAEPQS